MKKVFLDNLPRWKKGGKAKEGYINWSASIGHKIKFIYDDIEGELLIKDYIVENNYNYIIIEYENTKDYHLWIGDVKRCKLGVLLGKIKTDYIYKVGDIIDNLKNGRLKILEQTKVKCGNGKSSRNLKGYKYKCLICGDISEKSEDELKRNGCGVCAGIKLLKGYNDLWTTHPHIAKLLKDKEIGYKISFGCGKSQIFICDKCGNEQKLIINNMIKQGWSCKKCGDNISYPNKFIFNLLEQLRINFECEKIFDWSENKRYDFYINNISSSLIEAQGLQHYKYTGWGRNLKQEQKNDELKEKLAKANGINNYIVIDCRKSDMEFIKNSILNSKLSELFDLSNIDWYKCHEYACKSIVRDVCELWNNGMKSSIDIGNIFKLESGAIRRYLKQGAELGWCDYDVQKAKSFRDKKVGGLLKNKISKKVICLTNNQVFKSITEASINCKISITSISHCCSGKTKSSGGFKWMYYDDYIKQENIS